VLRHAKNIVLKNYTVKNTKNIVWIYISVNKVLKNCVKNISVKIL